VVVASVVGGEGSSGATGGVGEVLQCRGAKMEVGLGRIDKKSGRWWCSVRKGIGSGMSAGYW
jgi:hypothetical protein